MTGIDDEAHDWSTGGRNIAYWRCDRCERVSYFERQFCPSCGKATGQQQISDGRGTVFAVTLVERAPTPLFRALCPYAIVLVDLSEGFRMMAHGQNDLSIGDRVTARHRMLGETWLPYFVADAGRNKD